jgi:hypothetical protein
VSGSERGGVGPPTATPAGRGGEPRGEVSGSERGGVGPPTATPAGRGGEPKACDAPAVTRRERWARRAIGLAIAVVAFVVVMRNQRDVGIARDEVTYMAAGSSYARFWMDLFTFEDKTLTEDRIKRTFGGPPGGGTNSEHPPLVKTLMGFSEHVFHDKLGWTDELTAYRIPGAALNALLVFLVFVITCAVWGLPEAVVAAFLVLLLPRAVFHASIGCFDAPIAALWFATIYAYWRALASRRWSIVAGVCFGLALATKHNALLLPFAIGAHYTWVALRSRGVPKARAVSPAGGAGARVRQAGGWLADAARATGRGYISLRPSVILSFALLGPLVLVALWPWLWFDTFGHLSDWIGFHLHHTHYNFEYLGHNWNAPPFPWHVALVTTLFTVPVVTLAGGAIGAAVVAVRARRREAADAARAPGLLLLLSAGASIGPFFLGSTPIFGAEKHWMPAIPSLCIVAGVGVIWSARAAIRTLAAHVPPIAARRRTICMSTCAALGTLVVATAAVETFHAQPYALTSYNALAGGAPGGADLGMNRQFWGVSAKGVLPFLSTQKPGRVYSHDASMAWDLYRRFKELPPGFGDSGHENAGVINSAYALVIHELHFNRHDYLVWDAYKTTRPIFVLRFDGVPIVSVYKRP